MTFWKKLRDSKKIGGWGRGKDEEFQEEEDFQAGDNTPRDTTMVHTCHCTSVKTQTPGVNSHISYGIWVDNDV